MLNQVWQSGQLTVWRAVRRRVGDLATSAVIGGLTTDSGAYGGCHTVVFSEDQGLVAQAYLETWDTTVREGLPLSVHGVL